MKYTRKDILYMSKKKLSEEYMKVLKKESKLGERNIKCLINRCKHSGVLDIAE